LISVNIEVEILEQAAVAAAEQLSLSIPQAPLREVA
jgi:hypothetical protein